MERFRLHAEDFELVKRLFELRPVPRSVARSRALLEEGDPNTRHLAPEGAEAPCVVIVDGKDAQDDDSTGIPATDPVDRVFTARHQARQEKKIRELKEYTAECEVLLEAKEAYEQAEWDMDQEESRQMAAKERRIAQLEAAVEGVP